MITLTNIYQLVVFQVGQRHAEMHTHDKTGLLRLRGLSSLEKAGLRLDTGLPTATEIIISGSIKIN